MIEKNSMYFFYQETDIIVLDFFELKQIFYKFCKIKLDFWIYNLSFFHVKIFKYFMKFYLWIFGFFLKIMLSGLLPKVST
jgi:hypothetical protein